MGKGGPVNNVYSYSDDELAEIVDYSNDIVHQTDNHIIQAWFLGGLLIAKRELDRRESERANAV